MSGKLELTAITQIMTIAKDTLFFVRAQSLLNGLTIPMKRSIAMTQRVKIEASQATQTVAFPKKSLHMTSPTVAPSWTFFRANS